MSSDADEIVSLCVGLGRLVGTVGEGSGSRVFLYPMWV